MSNKRLPRLLSLLLVLALVCGLIVPTRAVESTAAPEQSSSLTPLTAEEVSADAVSAELPMKKMQSVDHSGVSLYSSEDENETVRVSIVLDADSTLEAGFDAENIADNAAAMQYRASLRRAQDQLCSTIESRVLSGRRMDVVWNLTLAANIISAYVPRSAMNSIAALPGVKSVVEETRYSPDVVSVGGTYTPNMAVSGQMTGAQAGWLEGYSGAGMRIAVIDTGIDLDHQSFAADAYAYALKEDAENAGRTVDSYNLLTAAEIADKADQLNATNYQGVQSSASDLYYNEKVPFGFNYIDASHEITHDNDAQGEHGSHVAGIASANRYIKRDGQYVDALESVGVVGNAPDAQLLIMKVFGANGGAYDADIMAGIEDAIILGADSVNLSLGSGSPGTAISANSEYQSLMESLVETGTVAVISAGNSYYWAKFSEMGNLYSDGVNFSTGGAPGSYTNSFTVASVDNDGMISAKIDVNGEIILFSDGGGTATKNEPFASLDTSSDQSGTEYDYVLIDGYGEPSDYTGIDLNGKIAVCSRGGGVYYSTKATNAVNAGARAVLVYNTDAGLVSIDLTGYAGTNPAASITKAAGDAMRSAATAHTTDDGKKTYYTGTLRISGKLTANYLDSQYLTMSDFSSFGMPGDLSLKPEITAPGGSIYSVNGGVSATDQYELMSGTSMAAPQVSGLAAQVQQYLKENNITVSDLNRRALTQALLMSTALQIHSSESGGGYYPVFQQGAGLANVQAAVQTPAYLTVDGMPDGKVKVELGDDPDRTGVYTFRFQINNFSDSEVSYQLSGDVFTQNVFTSGDESYLSTNTRPLSAAVDFRVNGASVMQNNQALANCDFNGDGVVNLADAQRLLDYVVGSETELYHKDLADLNGDGEITTYDVYLMLHLRQGYVNVPAEGSVAVDVTITLSDADRETLSKDNYPVGAYIESYISAQPAVVDDGVQLPTLSLPVLGFYGNWTESSMFDLTDFDNPEETRSPYTGTEPANAIGVVYGDNPSEVFYFGGNPVNPDEVYHPERNAINTERGDYFYAWKYAPIRNAAASRLTGKNLTTGEALFEPVYGGEVSSAYYLLAYGSWVNASQLFEIGLLPDLEEGEYGELSLTLAPEKYVSADGSVAWDELGAGATKTVMFTADNEAPELDVDSVVVDHENNVLRLTAKDNQYLAGVFLYDNTGRTIVARKAVGEDVKSGESYTFEVPLDDVNGYRFVVQVADYAANFATYKLKETIGEPEPLPTQLTFDTVVANWRSIGGTAASPTNKVFSKSDLFISAATAVGQYAYLVDDAMNLYVTGADDLEEGGQIICRLGHTISDMTYNKANGLIYAVTDNGMLLSIDKLTGAETELGYIGGAEGFAKTLAFDGEKFYCNKLKTGDVYSFTLSTIAEPVKLASYNSYYELTGEQTMEYCAADNTLRWYTSYESWGRTSFVYVVVTLGDTPSTRSYYSGIGNDPFSCVLFPEWEADDSWTVSDGQPKRIFFRHDPAETVVGYATKLDVTVLPWNLSEEDAAVSYESLTPEIATVDAFGNVTGVSVGTATIRVTAKKDTSVYADCKVNVTAMNLKVEGTLLDATGASKYYTWDLGQPGSTWETKFDLDSKYYSKAVAEIPGENAFYLLTSVGGVMHKLSMTDGKDLAEASSEFGDQNYGLLDMSWSNFFSKQDNAPRVYAVNGDAVLYPFDPLNSDEWSNFPMSKYTSGAIFVGAATGGQEKVTYKDSYGVYEYTEDSEVLYLYDTFNRVWRLNMFIDHSYGYGGEGRLDMVFSVTPTDLNLRLPTDTRYQGYSSMVVGSDGTLYLSAFNGSSSELYRLVYDEKTTTYTSVHLGSYGHDVWPGTLLHVSSDAAAVTAAPAATNRYYDGAVSVENTGSLNSLEVKSTAAVSGGVTYDTRNSTLTVPVTAQSSTNGLFDVVYDSKLLTLKDVCFGGTTLHSSKSGDAAVTVGYAAVDAYSGTVAELTFQYTPAAVDRMTELTLNVHQDGASTQDETQSVTVRIPSALHNGSDYSSGSTGAGSTTGSSSTLHYVDVKSGDWFYDAVKEMTELGYMNGVSADRFDPNGSLTRAMMVTILYRLDGSHAVSTASGFTDVVKNSWYENAVNWAAANGIVNGYSNNRFGPDDAITRQQMAAILWRYAQYKGMDVRANGTVLPDFTDRGQIASWAGEAISWAYSRGIMNGKSALRLDPEGGATRAEAAMMLSRLLNVMNNTSNRY